MAYVKHARLLGNAWAGEGAVVVGNVVIGDESSVWFNAVVRGDEAEIVIGSGTNIQDGAVVHVDTGHNSLIGMGAIVMNDARIGEDCIIGAGSLVTSGTVIPDGMMAFGNPAKIIRPLTEEEKKSNQTNAITYMMLKSYYTPTP